MTTIGSPPREPGQWEWPLPDVEQQIAALPLREAIARETALGDDREVSALSEALVLVTHPEIRVATDADYGPAWSEWLAQRIASNKTAGGAA